MSHTSGLNGADGNDDGSEKDFRYQSNFFDVVVH